MNYLIRNNSVTVVIDGYPHMIDEGHLNYAAVRDAVLGGTLSEDELLDLISVRKRGVQANKVLEGAGIVQVEGRFMYGDLPLPMDIDRYIAASLDYPDQSILAGVGAFVRNLYENPSHDTRQRLFAFMERNNLPITKDGCFMGFKVVTPDYLDKHTRKISNRPGVMIAPLAWSKVDTNPDQTCSYGYHVCSREYLPAFYSPGDRIVSVSVNPANVGAIPSDYNGSKIRCRHYTVVADITERCIEDLALATIRDDDAITPFDDDDDFYRRYAPDIGY
jgi:hypothetical protein